MKQSSILRMPLSSAAGNLIDSIDCIILIHVAHTQHTYAHSINIDFIE